jgi:hypothetical protein
MFLADVLPRHTVNAPHLWSLLVRLLANESLKACAEALRLPFALETLYHLRQRLRRRLDAIRSCLCRQQPAPASTQTDPLNQTVEHARLVFSSSSCPATEFQKHFACAFLG